MTQRNLGSTPVRFTWVELQMEGPGALLCFGVRGGLPAGRTLLENLRIASLAVSLGGVETLAQHPASMTHAGMARDKRLAAGITDNLIRLSVGCEDLEDLEADFRQALDTLPSREPPSWCLDELEPLKV